MHCPACEYQKTIVIETRDSLPEVTRRRRKCVKCDYRFTTYEIPNHVDEYSPQENREHAHRENNSVHD